MIPLKLFSRSVSRSSASFLLCPHSYACNGTLATGTANTTLRTKTISAISLTPWLASQKLAYSTEDNLSKSSSSGEQLSQSQNEPQPPPPASASSEEDIEHEKQQSKKSKKPKKSSSHELSSTDSSAAKDQTKIATDKLYKSIELEVLSYEPSVIDSYQWFVITAATHLGITVGKCWSPVKSDKFRFPLLKSAFVHKKHQVHYEIRTYHRFLTFHKLTGSTAETFLEYIERNLPEGVGMKVTKVEVQPLPDYLQQKN